MKNSHIALYHPINKLKPMGENIWIVDGEQISFYGLPFTTRMTVIRLSNGKLLIHSPIPLTNTIKEDLDALGEVSYLISPNKIHYYYIGDFQKSYPDAVTYASPGVRERAEKYKVAIRWDRDLDSPDPHAWEPEIQQVILRGSRFMEEVIFYHKASQTLIVTDFIENFEQEKIPFLLRLLARIGGALAPHGGLTRDQRLTYWGRKNMLRESLTKIQAFDFEQIILAHGKCITENARAEFSRVIGWVMK